jgi:hypothetical protein
MAYNEIFGHDKSLIEIQLGENPENKIQGYVNRTANSNGTPRIMGGKVLTEWIKKHYRQGDLLKIDILSNDSIKLNEKIFGAVLLYSNNNYTRDRILFP